MNKILKTASPFIVSVMLASGSGCGLSDLFKTNPKPVNPPAPVPTPTPVPRVLVTQNNFGTYTAPLNNPPQDILIAVNLKSDLQSETVLTTEVANLISVLTAYHSDFHLAIIDGSDTAPLLSPTVIASTDTSPATEASNAIHAISVRQQTESTFNPDLAIMTAGGSPLLQNFFRQGSYRSYISLIDGQTSATVVSGKIALLDGQAYPGIWNWYSVTTDTTDACNGSFLSDLSQGYEVCGLNRLHELMNVLETNVANDYPIISFRDSVPSISGVSIQAISITVNGVDWTSAIQTDTTRNTVIFNHGSVPPPNSVIKISITYQYYQ